MASENGLFPAVKQCGRDAVGEPTSSLLRLTKRANVLRTPRWDSPPDGKLGTDQLTLPLETNLRGDDRRVVVDVFRESEYDAGRELMNDAIGQGNAFPWETEFDIMEFRHVCCTHAAFVVRALEEGYDMDGSISKRGHILGIFTCKPKFNGRGDHVCDGLFVTRSEFRRKGIGRLMGSCFLKFASDLGYRAILIDLIFQSNGAAVSLFDSLGFTRAAELPNVLRLSDDHDDFDNAICFFYDIISDLPIDFDPRACSHQRDSFIFSMSS